MRNYPEIISTFPGTLPAACKSANGWAFAGSGQRPEMWKLIKDNSYPYVPPHHSLARTSLVQRVDQCCGKLG